MSKQAVPVGELVALESAGNELLDIQTMFLQNASHELRTPLNAVLGYSELLCDGYLGELLPEQKEAVVTIRESARSLHNIVEKMTLLMRAQAGLIEEKQLDIVEIVDDVVGEKVQDALAKQIKFDLHVEPELPMVIGDHDALTTALDCLVDNAVKFTPAGGQIIMQLYRDSGWLWLALQDSGPGIPHGAQAYVFNGFYQADRRLGREYEGLGLGLTVAREVVAALGGQLRLYSTPGQGSCFTVRLPTRPSQRIRKPERPAGAPQGRPDCHRCNPQFWYVDWLPHQPC